MTTFRVALFNLLGSYLILSGYHSGCSMDTVRPPPTLSLRVSENQSLRVSWLLNHSSLVGDIYELQISRTENHIIIYNRNVSAASAAKLTWMWTSDLPLECVDHSVRIRLYNQSAPSPWSNWVTQPGAVVRDKSEIFPRGRVLREGSSATFCCVPPSGVDVYSMSFKKKKQSLISTGTRVKAITVGNLTIPKKTSLSSILLVSCNDTTGKEVHVWNYVSFPPEKPRNLSCSTSDMETITCTWHPSRKRSKYDRNKQNQTLQIVNSDQAPVRCAESSCKFPLVPQLEEYNISVVVRDRLGEETESYTFNVSDRVCPVVEWDITTRAVIPGVTAASVFWTVLGNLTRLDLLCQVATGHDSGTFLSCHDVRGRCRAEVEPLMPNTRYSARVRCSVGGKLWGDWTQPVSFTTHPLVKLDLWRTIKQLSSTPSRQVTLLWTLHAVGGTAAVNVRHYTVQWLQGGENRTEGTDGGQTQAEASVGPGQCEVTVQAELQTGLSVSAHISIPPRDDRVNLPVKKQLSSGSASGFPLSWEGRDTATCGYTVEWCILGSVLPCTLKWEKTPQGNSTLFLPGRQFIAGCRYTFNIYGCTENGHRLLEIQTGYSEELISVQSPHLVEPVQRTSSSVTLQWRYDEEDPTHPAFIAGYLVTVQDAEAESPQSRMENLFNMSVEDPQRKSVTVEGLQQSHEYVFTVSALTKVGPGQAASITIRTRTNYSMAVAKILTPILLLLGCTVLLWPQRKMLKSGLKDIFSYPAGMHIKVPELDSFPNETGEWLRSQRLEECISCDIEILNIRPTDETAALRDPEVPHNMPSSSSASQSSPSASSLSPSCELLRADYCPQSAVALWDTRGLQQVTSVANKTYFDRAEEDNSSTEPHAASGEISSFEPSECLQESCPVIYGYISNKT